MNQPLGIQAGLRRRLLLLLLVPLVILSVLSTWFDIRSADNAALQQDRLLLELVPLLADSVVSGTTNLDQPPALLRAPAIDEFLNNRTDVSAIAIADLQGRVLVGPAWLSGLPPTTAEPEFNSEEFEGTTYRIVSQRARTIAGEVTLRIADGSDPRQQWLRQLWLKVALPNLLLVIAGFFGVNWAVNLALKPLIDLKETLERRAPGDLSALDARASPEEVRPLVLSLNRLFGLVDAQAESQRRFVADAAHQLRTPLAALQAQVEAWAQAVSPDKYRQNDLPAHTERAQAAITLGADQVLKLRLATRRTSQLASQLLALSRADARTASAVPTQRVDLQQLCEVVLESQIDAATAKGIDLGLETLPVHVSGYEWLLRELLSNLVDNAVKYTPPGGRVTLRCGLAEGGDTTPYLEVEDDGPGIAPAERAHVLERFYRIPGTVGEGNGLGLAIAAEIARVHHSTLFIGEGAGERGLRVRLILGGLPHSDSCTVSGGGLTGERAYGCARII